MKKKKCAVIGCGRMFQTYHYRNIINNKFVIDTIFDPREKLVNHIGKKLSIKRIFFNFKKFLKFNRNKIIFFFLPKEVSFYFLNEILNHKNIKIFIEKPPLYYLKNYNKIKNKLLKNNNKLVIGYMFRYSRTLLEIKKLINKDNKKIDYISGEMSLNYNINNENFVTFHERIDKKFNETKNLSKKNINYKIFLNRYSHLINLIYFLFDDIVFKKIRVFKRSLYNYIITFKIKDLIIKLNLNNKSRYKVKLNIHKKSKQAIMTEFNFKPKLKKFSVKFSKEKNIIEEDLYFNEINSFNSIEKKKYSKQLDDFEKTLLVIKNLFK